MQALYFFDGFSYEKTIIDIKKLSINDEKIEVEYTELKEVKRWSIDLSEYSEYSLFLYKDNFGPEHFKQE